MRYLKFPLLVTFVLLGLAHPRGIEAAADELVIGTGEYPPYTTEAMPDGGIASHVVRKVFDAAGRKVRFRFLPWGRTEALAKRVKVDAAIPYVHTPDRARDFLYSDVFVTFTSHFFFRTGEPVTSSGLERLRGQSHCLPLGYGADPRLEPLMESGQLRRENPPRMADCVRMLLLGRADFLLEDVMVMAWLLKDFDPVARAGIDHRYAGTPVEDGFMIVSRQHPRAAEIISQFNRSLAQLRDSGELPRLLGRYRSENLPQTSGTH